MRQSLLFTKTKKETPKDETSVNAQLLLKAGFIHKDIAGVYTYLPLGLKVLNNIKEVIRQELDAIGCQEIAMTALQPKEMWEKTNRWSDEIVDNWFKTSLKNKTELGLAFTHEEPMANMMKQFVSSYKDLPKFVYQFQTKFRNELRAKSGIMRGREFIMKDLYSFHSDKEAHDVFYDQMKEVYMKIFTRLGLGENTFLTMSSGQPFSKYSFEFQALSEAGEDVILFDREKNIAINKDDYSDEIFEDFGLNKDDYNFEEGKSIEIGDIYSLGTKYSEALGLMYADSNSKEHPVFMGSYGIGVPRVMGTVVETSHDEHGLIWPKEIAPYQVHLVSLCQDDEDIAKAEDLYKKLKDAGVEVLYDDRSLVRAGQKFADSDLIGIPMRVVISKKMIKLESVEVTLRGSNEEAEIITISELMNRV